MGKLVDLSGRTFGLLTVLRRIEDRKPGRPMWLCQCECGNTVVVSSTNLLKKMEQSHVGACGISNLPPSLI